MEDKNKKEFKDIFKDVIALGKQLFGNSVNEFKLADGTTIVRLDTETFSKGSKINCVTEKGEVPLVDGKYSIVLKEGEAPVEFTVASGFITEMAAPPTPNAAPGTMPPMADKSGDGIDASKIADVLNQILQRLDALEKAAATDAAEDSNEDAPGAQDMADYPWEQCIADQMKQYGDQATAEKVCASIKNGTVTHRSMVNMAAMAVDNQIELGKVKEENKKLTEMLKVMLSAVEKLNETPEPTKKSHGMRTQTVTEKASNPNSLEERIEKIKKINNQ